MIKLTSTAFKKRNKLRSICLEYTNKEVSEYLKSTIFINSISIQKYLNQFTCQVIEMKSQSFSSNTTSTPKHYTSNILKLPREFFKQNSIAKSPKKKKIGKEKLTRFQNQINLDSSSSSSPKLNLNSLQSIANISQLNKSFESSISVRSKHSDRKSTKKEGRDYLKQLSLSFKQKVNKSNQRGSQLSAKTPHSCYFNYNPLLYKEKTNNKESEDLNMNTNPTKTSYEGNSMFTITLNSCLESMNE